MPQSPERDLAQLLEAQGVGTVGATTGWGIYENHDPPKPRNCINISSSWPLPPTVAINQLQDDYDGYPDGYVEYPALQCRVLGMSFDDTREKAREIMRQVVNRTKYLNGDWWYLAFYLVSGPLYLGQDEKKRHIYAVNLKTVRRPSPDNSIVLASRVAVFSGANYLSDAQSVAAWQVDEPRFTITGALYVDAAHSGFVATNFGDSASNRAYYLWLQPDATLSIQAFGPSSPAPMGAVSSDSLNVGAWNRWAVYLDQVANELGVSINGGAYTTTALAGAIRSSASNFLLGSLYGASNFLIGQQSGIGVYKGVILSQDQCLALSKLDEGGNARPIDYSSLPNLSGNDQDYDMTESLVEWLQLDDEDNIFRKKVDGLSLTNVNSVTTTPYP